MQKIGISYELGINPEMIAEEISRSLGLNPQIYHENDRLVQDFNGNILSGLLFGINNFTPKHLERLFTIHEQIPSVPIVVAYNDVDVMVKESMDLFETIAIVKNKDELRDLPGIFTKLLESQPVLTRTHIRFPTQLETKIINAGKELPSRLINLSKTGACIKNLSERFFKLDENFQLYIPSEKSDQAHIMKANVVWTKEVTGMNPGEDHQQIGLRLKKL